MTFIGFKVLVLTGAKYYRLGGPVASYRSDGFVTAFRGHNNGAMCIPSRERE